MLLISEAAGEKVGDRDGAEFGRIPAQAARDDWLARGSRAGAAEPQGAARRGSASSYGKAAERIAQVVEQAHATLN